ncbi:MAG: 4Fe-4S binding protein [Monoglobaceae bacterium]
MVAVNSKYIKEKAYEYGAAVCGIAEIDRFADEIPLRNPKSICPKAKSVIGFGFYVPSGLYRAMENKNQSYLYTSVGVKYIDEELSTIFLCKMASLIENEGYDACLQRSVPNMKINGDKTANPEIGDVYEITCAQPVAPGRPAPEVIIDYNKAAVLCGLGTQGINGKVINPKYGPCMRYVFIITDMELEEDELLTSEMCDNCGECIKACPGHAVSEQGVDTWQCAVYYKGAHKSNPFMTDDFLKGDPEREAVINGDKHFDADEAKKIIGKIDFLPMFNGYFPCLCGKGCEYACFKHLKEIGKI